MSEIKKLGELLETHIKPDCAIIDYASKRLTAPGENYGSLMLAVELKLKNSYNEEEVLSLVAKLIPENLWLRNMFNVEYTFPKEMNFYDKIIPTLIDFQMEQGMEHTLDIFPKYYGGRLNLNPGSDKVDEDGVIMLENLKMSGYITVDRIKGFNKETTEFILKDLAVFHAVPVALKMKKPKLFEDEIMPHIKFVKLFDTDSETDEKTIRKYENFARESTDCKHLVDRIRQTILKCMESWGVSNDGPFATITHNDYWVNNTMLKFDASGKPVSNKMVDFQIQDYGSPGKDVVFFLFSSVQIPLVEQYYDHFLKIYHSKFIETLERLHCDISPFSFEAFEKELEVSAKHSEFVHCLVMSRPILASPLSAEKLKDMSESDLVDDHIPEREKEKALFIIREFAKRSWIL